MNEAAASSPRGGPSALVSLLCLSGRPCQTLIAAPCRLLVNAEFDPSLGPRADFARRALDPIDNRSSLSICELASNDQAHIDENPNTHAAEGEQH